MSVEEVEGSTPGVRCESRCRVRTIIRNALRRRRPTRTCRQWIRTQRSVEKLSQDEEGRARSAAEMKGARAGAQSAAKLTQEDAATGVPRSAREPALRQKQVAGGDDGSERAMTS